MYIHRLTSAGATDESEVVEARHLVLEGGRGVAELRGAVLVVSRRQYDLDAVAHVAEREDLEGDGQRLVASPVGGQYSADEVGGAGSHQLARVLGQDLGEGPLAAERLGALRRSARSGGTVFARRRRHGLWRRRLYVSGLSLIGVKGEGRK